MKKLGFKMNEASRFEGAKNLCDECWCRKCKHRKLMMKLCVMAATRAVFLRIMREIRRGD